MILKDPKNVEHYTKMKFSINDSFSKCEQIRWKLQIWSHLHRIYWRNPQWKTSMKNQVF